MLGHGAFAAPRGSSGADDRTKFHDSCVDLHRLHSRVRKHGLHQIHVGLHPRGFGFSDPEDRTSKDAANVRVDNGDALSECESGNRPRGVRAYTRKGLEGVDVGGNLSPKSSRMRTAAA